MAALRGSVIVWCLLCLAMDVWHVHSFDLTIIPERGHLNQAGDNMTVTCQANQPITHCQFNFVKDEDNWEGPLLDLSQGAETIINRSHLSGAITGYRYSGSGLRNGQCGITLNLRGWKRWMLGCRVRGTKGGWRYAIMSFTADQSSSIPVTVTPRHIVALPGSSLSILCKTTGPLDWCRMDTPGSLYGHLFLDQGAESAHSTNEHRYYGAGVASGECGVTFPSVSEGINGYAFCGLVTMPGKWERTGIPVVVARAPNSPKMKIKPQNLTVGSQLEATCTVDGGRPVANITWYLDDEVLRRDAEDDVPDATWRWPTSLQKVTQKLKRRLLSGDAGRELRCEAAHVALPQPLVARSTLVFSSALELEVCPPLTSQSVLISCSMAGEEVDCGQPQPIGAVALLTCKPGFTLPSSIVYRKITCMRGSKWNRPVYTCHPDCGRRNTNGGGVLVAGGKDSKIGEFPWHVGIYQTSTGGGIPVQMCGGTLISANIVVSAAHCFWNNQKVSANDARLYKVAAGQHSRAWDAPDVGSQKRDVLQVVTHTLFRGRNTGFSSDIAILRLESAFEVNAKVNLVCVDWDNALERRQLVAGNIGVVAGWGYTEDGVQSDTLKYVDLPFVPSETCLDELSVPLQQLFTSDKICAGYVNQSTSVCRGDSGGGLVFRDPGTDKYYLRGIVSIAYTPPSNNAICYSQFYTGFTRFSQYIHWTQDNV